MKWTRFLGPLSLAAISCGLAGCHFNDKQVHCNVAADCGAGHECFAGFCVRLAADGGTTSSGSGGAGKPSSAAGTGSGGRAGTGASGTSGVAGDASAGTVASMAGSAGSASCQDGEQRTCAIGTNSSGSCNRGVQTCAAGAFGACTPDFTPSTETCNGVDDDCDGKVDEDSDVACYPDGMTGCSASDNAFVCVGTCRVGKRACDQGKLGDCTGYTGPQNEACTTSGTAADENCDGRTDENCTCTGTSSHSCYSGPMNTEGVGICKAGTQACSNGAYSMCMNSVTPGTETCANPNADDDCNGKTDDIPQLGTPCTVAANSGPCKTGTQQCQAGSAALTCVTPAPTAEVCNNIDDDCNGKVDDGFDLQNDPAHCGNCMTACTMSQMCCAGKCVDTTSDAANCGGCGGTHVCPTGNACCASACVDLQKSTANCGMCGKACTAGGLPSCCSGTCADLASNANCGSCGHACGLATLPIGGGAGASAGAGGSAGASGGSAGSGGSVMCMCMPSGTTAQCSAAAPAVCL